MGLPDIQLSDILLLVHTCKMKMKVIFLLVGTALVAGSPQPDYNIDADVMVNSSSVAFDSYFDVVKNGAKTTLSLMTYWLGSLLGYDCCYVEGQKYDNGATVPCGLEYSPGTLGKCVDGNIQCEEDQMVTPA